MIIKIPKSQERSACGPILDFDTDRYHMDKKVMNETMSVKL